MTAPPNDPDARLFALSPAYYAPAHGALRLKLGGGEVLRRVARMLEEPGIAPDCSLTLDDLLPDLISVRGHVR